MLLFLLLGGAVAGNCFKLPLYFKLDVLFGSIFTMIIIQLFGLRWGLVSALVSSASGWLLWDHHFSGLNFILEAVFVGYFRSRRDKEIVFLSTTYWLLLGMPLAWLYFRCYRSMPVEFAALIMLKQGVNGIVDTLAAKLIVILFPLSRYLAEVSGKRQVSLQQIISTIIAVCVVFPLLGLTILSIRAEYQAEMMNLSRELTHVANRSQGALSAWLKARLTTLSTLAQFKHYAADVAGVREYIRHVNEWEQDILQIGLVNRRGVSVAYDPPVDPVTRESNIGVRLATEARLRAIRAAQRPIFWDAVAGVSPGHAPAVVVDVPVIASTGFDGYVAGVLDLEGIRRLLKQISREWSCNATLLDGDRRVLASTDPAQQPLKTFRLGNGRKTPLDSASYHWVPQLQGSDVKSAGFLRSYYVRELPVGLDTSWQLVIGLPLAPRLHYLTQLSAKHLTFMIVWTILALIASGIIGRRLASSLNRLGETTTGLPDLISRHREIVWPSSLIADVSSLVDNFKAVSASLSGKFGELTVTNRELSREVHERTATEEKLRRATLELSAIFQAFPDHCLVADASATILDERGGQMQAGAPGGGGLRGKRVAEIFPPPIAGKYCHGIEEVLATGSTTTFEYRRETEDGDSFFEARIVPLPPQQVIIIVRNVTDLKKAEELRISNEQLRNLSIHLEKVREKERAFIAREIHDELGQRLTALRFDLGWVGKRLAAGETTVSERVSSMAQLVEGTIRTVRRIAMELRPRLLDDLGLVAAMEWQVTEFEERTGIVCVLHVARSDVAVEQMRATAVFRILQEALTNIIRHAEATRVDVTFAKEKGILFLKVIDNGRGIGEDQASGKSSFGIMGMTERVREWNGMVTVTSEPGKGTSITVIIPTGDEEV